MRPENRLSFQWDDGDAGSGEAERSGAASGCCCLPSSRLICDHEKINSINSPVGLRVRRRGRRRRRSRSIGRGRGRSEIEVEAEAEAEAEVESHWDPSRRKHSKPMEVRLAAICSTVALMLILLLASDSRSLLAAGEQTGAGAQQNVLLDTTELSQLGWTKYPDGGASAQARTPGWVEESFTNFERGINWRSFVVCDVAFTSVNNWLWTPFIERADAQRLHIEIKFTMRDCNLFPQMVLSCKETFALLYREADAPLAAGPSNSNSNSDSDPATPTHSAGNASFAQSDSFQLIDAIAADEGRFTSNNDVVINTEVRSVPVSKRGVYFAFRDQGACLSLISVRVFALRCPELTRNFARFPSTPVGRELTSLVAVQGDCVDNSVQLEPAKLFCAADGQWSTMSSGQCRCLAGFEPAHNQSRCSPCPAHKFKPLAGDAQCQSCPEHSDTTTGLANVECHCQPAYYRAPRDPRTWPCSQPPSAPTNLSAVYVDSGALVVEWSAPRSLGGRDDLQYRVVCDGCGGGQWAQQQQQQQQPADQPPVSSPPLQLQQLLNATETKLVLANLQPNQLYRLLVYALNGVSQQAGGLAHAHYAEIQVQTRPPQVQTNANTLSSQNGFQLLPIYNLRALQATRGTDLLLAWDAQQWQPTAPTAAGGDNSNSPDNLPAAAATPTEQQAAAVPPSLFEVRWQARFGHAPAAASSPYSLLTSTPQLADQQQQQQQSLSTTSRALLVSGLQPRTQYAFQIRAKWPHSNQWTDWSEPIFASTSAGPSGGGGGSSGVASPPALGLDFGAPLDPNFDRLIPPPLSPSFGPNSNLATPTQSSGGSAGSLVVVVFVCLIAFVMLTLGLLHHHNSRRSSLASGGGGPLPAASSCLQSMLTRGGFGAAHSTYAGVYNGGASSDLIHGVSPGYGGTLVGAYHTHAPNSVVGPGPLGSSSVRRAFQHGHAHSTGSAGALITGSSSTSRSSSSSSGNVVQQFIAATLGAAMGRHHHHQPSGGPAAAKTLVESEGRATAAGQQQAAVLAAAAAKTLSFVQPVASQRHQQPPRYHQMQPQQQQQQMAAGAYGDLLLAGANSQQFRYTTNSRPGHEHYGIGHLGIVEQTPVAGQQQQQHIYDDLDTNSSSVSPSSHSVGRQQQQQQPLIIGSNCISLQQNQLPASSLLAPFELLDTQAIAIGAQLGRGEFGDIYAATLQLPVQQLNQVFGQQQQQQQQLQPGRQSIKRQLAARLLASHANDRLKVKFLAEATLLAHFEHPNILALSFVSLATGQEQLQSQLQPPAAWMMLVDHMPNGQLDSYLRNHKNQLNQMQLISMLRDIANGMQYLASLNFVHKDLAARNILVDERNSCKISGFGATLPPAASSPLDPIDWQPNRSESSSSSSSSPAPVGQLVSVAEQLVRRRLIESANQNEQPTAPLLRPNETNSNINSNNKIPVRWTALEAIALGRFSSASDVWSFGVLAWELTSLGERPYWNWSNLDVIKAVEQGYRLPQPEACPDQIYKLMLDCWLKDRVARPNFAQICRQLDQLLSPYDDPFSRQQQQQQQQQQVVIRPN